MDRYVTACVSVAPCLDFFLIELELRALLIFTETRISPLIEADNNGLGVFGVLSRFALRLILGVMGIRRRSLGKGKRPSQDARSQLVVEHSAKTIRRTPQTAAFLSCSVPPLEPDQASMEDFTSVASMLVLRDIDE